MEFICRFHDADELQRVRGLLRSKGIPTFAPQVEPRRMGAQWTLFVYLNEQADDARRILRDPGHQPAHPVGGGLRGAGLCIGQGRMSAAIAAVFTAGASLARSLA
ncbi:MAG: hypothetical protein HOQ32_13710 [Lysobacter sp.]|nr:hypothetical protein [Lysobacter sp.]